MKAPMTREKYRRTLAKFFDFIDLSERTIEERAKIFLRFHVEKEKTTRCGSWPDQLLKTGPNLYSLKVKDRC
jgi:hypothetical protein